MPALQCVITSPEGLIFKGSARSVVLPGADGELGVLPRHAPLIGALGYGEVRIDPADGGAATGGTPAPARGKDGKIHYFIEGGFVQVLRDEVSILATRAESSASLNRAAEEEKLKALLAKPPAANAPVEERDAYHQQVRIARARIKASGG
jgi:F-type H+-transporting ATPase subunit epsilon